MKGNQNKDLVSYRLTKARETMNEINLHLANELWNTAVNRLYYACFYAVSALLLSFDIQARTHSGVRQMFGLHFIRSGLVDKELGKFYSDLFDKRQTSDYDDYVEITKEEVIDFIKPANQLISKIENLINEP